MKMGRKFIGNTVFLLTLILWSSNTYAYEVCKTSGGKDIKWRNPDATYLINTSVGPSGSLSAIQEGMQTWTDLGPSEFVFIFGGTTTSTAHGINDGDNIVTFGSLGAGTVAENRFWYNVPTGRILDSDIQFNTYYTWSTDGSSGTMDVQNVGTHEHGHSLCLVDLYDSADSQKTMYGNVAYGETKKRTLHQDDIDGITYLYTCPNAAVRIQDPPTAYFSALQAAYDNAGGGEIVQGQNVALYEDIFIDSAKSVTFEGGYSCDYASIPGTTVIYGDMIISDGLLIVGNGKLELR